MCECCISAVEYPTGVAKPQGEWGWGGEVWGIFPRGFAACIRGFTTEIKALVYKIPPAMQAKGGLVQGEGKNPGCCRGQRDCH